MGFFLQTASGYAIESTIAPAISAKPIEVLLWVRDTVTTEDEAYVHARIREALQLWEDVPTAHLRFTTSVVRSPTAPPRRPEQLLVIVANQKDLTSGGAFLPYAGYPGTWLGAVADWTRLCTPGVLTVLGMPDCATWLRGVAYPEPTLPLSAVSATVRGRCVSTRSGKVLAGVNVVAVEAEGGWPVLARPSGLPTGGTVPMEGLPPGRSDLLALDGASVAGTDLGLAGGAFQRDNFVPFRVVSLEVTAGEVIDLGDIPVAIEPLVTGWMGKLPGARVGVGYDHKLWLRGGVRPLRLVGVQRVPQGLTIALYDASRENGGCVDGNGRYALRISGTPTTRGDFVIEAQVRDAHGEQSTIVFGLDVGESLRTTTSSTSTSTTTRPAAGVTTTSLVSDEPDDRCLALVGGLERLACLCELGPPAACRGGALQGASARAQRRACHLVTQVDGATLRRRALLLARAARQWRRAIRLALRPRTARGLGYDCLGVLLARLGEAQRSAEDVLILGAAGLSGGGRPPVLVEEGEPVLAVTPPREDR